MEAAGWRFFANGEGPANIQLEASVKLTANALAALGDNFEKTARGVHRLPSPQREGLPVHHIGSDFKAVPVKYRTLIPEYTKDFVPLNQFAA